MPLIKRYPNRKLYDTERKRYITLDGIADLIQQGEEIQVLDYSTNEDLTTVTLSQIIFEQEKKQSGFVPRNVLAGLVQAGGDTLSSLRSALASPLEMLYDIDEEIGRRIHNLVEAGDLSEEEGDTLLEKLLAQSELVDEEEEKPGEIYLKKILSRRGIPTHDEIVALTQQIDALSTKLDAIVQENAAQETE